MNTILAAAAVGSSEARTWIPGASGALLLNTTVAPGRRRTVLEVAGTVAAAPESPDARPRLWARVNGVALGTIDRLQADHPGSDPGSEGSGRAAFSFRLDIDRAEAERPGQFIHRPLHIELFAGDAAERGFHARAAVLSGRLVRKRADRRTAAANGGLLGAGGLGVATTEPGGDLPGTVLRVESA